MILFSGRKNCGLGPLGGFYPRARRLQGEGFLAVPGYLDQHVHLTGGSGSAELATRMPKLRASACIGAGVTTVVGTLGTDGITRSIENLVAKTKALNEEEITAGFAPVFQYSFNR
ncbi:MAG: hypothetical protein GX335_06690 [Firmicutes bacterium]|nr:hypothetical protein [Bacillota bacterium]